MVRTIVSWLLLAVLMLLSVKLWLGEQEKRSINDDLAHLSEIRYGLFNVDEWKEIIVNIISKNIEEFDLDPRDRKAMREKVTEFLNSLIDDFEKRYHQEERNRSGGFFEQTKGALRSAVVSGTKLFDHMREDIPVFTEEILDFVSDPENAKMLKSYLSDKLDEYAAETFAETDYTERDRIVAKYSAKNKVDAIRKMESRLTALDSQLLPFKVAWFALVLTVLAMVVFVRLNGAAEYLMLIGACIVLLIVGVSLPMLEIDARIASLSFTLLGEEVTFTDQVVYHRCKSIIEVVHLMLVQNDLKITLVGILILLFSVLFPTSKLVCSILYLYSERLRKNQVVRFMVFKTGKWSMADVMVVAIFMAYVGFTGIINEQLGQLETLSTGFRLLTTDNSTLLFGFYAFVAFVLFSLVLSNKISRIG